MTDDCDAASRLSPGEAGPRSRMLTSGRERVAREAMALGAILAFSLALRVVALDTLPPNVAESEANSLRDVYRIIAGRGGPSLFGLDSSGSPALNVYLIAAFIQIFGSSIASMRMASAVLSTLALLPLYYIARDRLSAKASLIVCFVTSSDLLYLHSSRNAWQFAIVCFFSLTSVCCLVYAIRGCGAFQGRLLFGLSGVSAALAAYGGDSGRLAIVLPLAFLPFALLADRKRAGRVLIGFALLFLTAFALLAPQVPTILARSESLAISASTPTGSSAAPARTGGDTGGAAAKTSLIRSLNGFVLLDGQAIDDIRLYPVGRPILDPVTGSLYAVGLAAAVYGFRRYALWLCMLFGSLAAMQLPSLRASGLELAVTLVAPMCLIAGRGFEAIGARGGNWRLLQLATLVALPWAVYDNVSTYFIWSATPAMAAARQPAVEVAEFGAWRKLQVEAAARGEEGLSAEEWQQVRGQYVNAPQRPTPSAQPPAQPDAGRPNSGAPAFAAQPAPRLLIRDVSFKADLFAQPRGVAFAPGGGLYVADAGAHEVVRLDPQGKVRYRIGGEGSGDGQFLEPWDVAVDLGGRLYVLDALQQSVQRFSPTGDFEVRLLVKEGMYRPRGLAIGGDDSIYVADTGRNRVVKADRDGRLLAVFGEAGSDLKLNQPTDVAVDSSGAIWVVEPDAKRLQRIDAAGGRGGVWGYPAADTLDAPHLAITDEWLLGTDPSQRRLVFFSLVGTRVATWQPPENGGFQFSQPFAVAADSAGAFAVSDSRSGAVLMFRIGSVD